MYEYEANAVGSGDIVCGAAYVIESPHIDVQIQCKTCRYVLGNEIKWGMSLNRLKI